MYRIQSGSKRHLINLAYLGEGEKTLAVTREASSEIYVSQYFKPKKSFIALRQIFSVFCYIDVLNRYNLICFLA